MSKLDCRELLSYLSSQEAAYVVFGDFTEPLEGFCSLASPKDGCILWVKHPEASDLSVLRGKQNLAVVSPDRICVPGLKNLREIITPEPKALFFRILEQFWGNRRQYGIAETAVIEGAILGEGVSVGHHCYIAPGVIIGEGSVLEYNVTIINHVEIGKGCIIHSGTVIGTDGFGYYVNHAGQPCKVEHYGGVHIGNYVEIGANTCIDRGTLGDTVIRDHCKIDNLVHIAHNVEIGENVMVVAQSLIAGSAKLGKNSYVAPGAIVKNQLTIGENAFVGMGAVVTKDIEKDMVAAGVPAQPIRKVSDKDK